MNRLFASLLASLALASAVPAVAQEAPDAAATPATPAASFPLSANFNIDEDRENILLLDLSTGRRVAIRLVPQWAPGHVARIKELARSGFYNGVIFHRVIDGFMAQTGDPTGTGQGQSELPDLTAEFNQMPHVRGSVSMARLGNDENSANSQFFIVFYPRFALDRNYTNFGRVIAGMDAVDAIERGEPPSNPTVILQASIAADNVAQMMPTAPEPVAAPQVITGEMLRGVAGN
jgi:cyclophilin family peptidyl-prolyl cis-trans isomerase